MKNKKELETTTNRTVYNRAYKINLERTGKIRCSMCKYHKGENYSTKWYGGFENEKLRYPNWKLSSNKRKQWMYSKSDVDVLYNERLKQNYITINI